MRASECESMRENWNSSAATSPGLILLAGGNSSRMGVPKGLLPWQGGTLLEAHCQQFCAVGGSFVVVVLGFHSSRYLKELRWLKGGDDPALQRVIYSLNPTPENGQFSSLLEGLKCALSFRNQRRTSVFVQPVDMPPPDKEVYFQLYHSMERGQQVAIPTFGAQSGHPVLLSYLFQRELLALQPGSEKRLDHLIHNLPEASIGHFPVEDRKVILNFNSPSDLSFQETQGS